MILTHYFQPLHPNQYCSKQELFTTITEYNNNEQKHIATNLSHRSGRAYHRFRLFDDYIHKRYETEKWLYSTFLCAGGKPITPHPFYFILGENEQLKADFGMGTNELILDTDHVDTRKISFTLGDSVGIYFSQAQKRLYSLEDVKTIYLDQNFVQEQMMPLQPYHRYIEAQLWDKHYLEKAMIMTDYPAFNNVIIIPHDLPCGNSLQLKSGNMCRIVAYTGRHHLILKQPTSLKSRGVFIIQRKNQQGGGFQYEALAKYATLRGDAYTLCTISW